MNGRYTYYWIQENCDCVGTTRYQNLRDLNLKLSIIPIRCIKWCLIILDKYILPYF